MKSLAASIVAGVVLIAAYGPIRDWWRGSGFGSDRSAEIADSIGASSCTATGYELSNRLDGSKSQIYTCLVDDKRLCVTEENGIARDETATVRLLWANTLSGDKPDCLYRYG